MSFQVPIEISARHVHLSRQDIDKLFGPGYQIKIDKTISQPNQFVAQERIDLHGLKSQLKQVAIVGPERNRTQVELSQTDAVMLGLDNIPVLASGDIESSVGGLTLRGPAGQLQLEQGIIIAQRHLHITPQQAQEFKIKDGDLIKIKVAGTRPLIFENVSVRSREGVDNLALHLDTDEANAAGLKPGAMGEIIS